MCQYLQTKINLKELKLVEIGSYAGDSTEIFCDFFKKVIAIDPWQSNVGGITNTVDMPAVYQLFITRCKDKPNLHVLKHFSHDVAKLFANGEIDVVYIDGDHSYQSVQQDTTDWLPKVRVGGFICGHDYHATKFPGVVKAVHEVIGIPDKIFRDTSWIKEVR